MKQTDNRQKKMIQSKAQTPHHASGPLRDKHISVPESEHGEEGAKKEVTEPIKVGPKIGRNDPCSCGSGKKYKKCCLDSQSK